MAFKCSPDFITAGAVKKSHAAWLLSALRYEHPMFICSWEETYNVEINHCYQFCTGHKK